MKKPIIFAAPVALALLAAAYFFVLPMLKGSAPPAKPADAANTADDGGTPTPHKKKHSAPGLVYPIAEHVLNLASPDGAPHYARIALALEFIPPDGYKPKPAAAEKGTATPPPDPALAPVAERMPQINDALVRIVGSKTVQQMTSADGKDQFKQEFSAAIGEIVPAPDLQAVYITELVVQ